MRLLVISFILLPILLALADGAPPTAVAAAKEAPGQTMSTTHSVPTGTGTKKGKQLVYFTPARARMADEDNVVQNQEDEEEEADDDVEEDADDDLDDDDDAGFDIPNFEEVFPNPDGRPVGPNSYNAFAKHNPANQYSQGGPAAAGQAGPRVAGQAGPRVSGQSGPGVSGHHGPGQRRHDYFARIDLQDGNGPQLAQYIPNDSTEEVNTIYPKRDGRQGYNYRNRVANYRYRPIAVPVSNYNNYNRRQYIPYRRPPTGMFYRQQVGRPVYPTQMVSRPVVYNPSPIRRNIVPVPVPMSNYKRPAVRIGGVPTQTPVRPTYVIPSRVNQARLYNPWSNSPLRGDNYNPEYIINPKDMLSRRKFRYHPSQAIPKERIPFNDGYWGNPKQIQRDPWTGAQYTGGYWSSQI